MSVTLQNFTSGDWQVLYSKGHIFNTRTGKKFDILITDSKNAAVLTKEKIIDLLNKISAQSFEKAEYRTDDQLYFNVTKQTHAAIFQITPSAPTFPQGAIACAQSLSREALQATAHALSGLVDSLDASPQAKLVQGCYDDLASKLEEEKDVKVLELLFAPLFQETMSVRTLSDLLDLMVAGKPVSAIPIDEQIEAFITSLPDLLLFIPRFEAFRKQVNLSEIPTSLWSVKLQLALLNGNVNLISKERGAYIHTLEAVSIALEKRRTEHFETHEKALLRSCETALRKQDHRQLKKDTLTLLSKGAFPQAFSARSREAQNLTIPTDHPLWSMDSSIAAQTAQSPAPLWGAYYSSFPTKGGHLHASRRNIEGEGWRNCFDFKIPLVEMEQLQTNLLAIVYNIDEFNKHLPPGLCQGVTITQTSQKFRKRNAEGVYQEGFDLDKPAFEIEFKGFGKVVIGISPRLMCFYNCVFIEMLPDLPAGEGILKLNQMLTLLGMGPLLQKVDPEVEERIKIASLTRLFFPSIMTELAKDAAYYKMSIEQIKKKIITMQPQMGSIFQKYEDHPDLLRKREAFPGKNVWEVSDFESYLLAAGCWGLMAGIGDATSSFDDLCNYVVRRLSEGTVSSEDRFIAGWLKIGLSSTVDLEKGGGNQVFLRMITASMARVSINQFVYSGEIQILYDPSILNRGGYAYPNDEFGSKASHLYDNRPNLIASTQNLKPLNIENEVMIKNRIPPEYIRGVVVATKEKKAHLIQVLTAKGVVKEGLINNIPVDAFVRIQDPSKPFKEEYWRGPL